MRWRAFPLHPETPPEGRTLEDLFAGRPVDIPSMLAHLRQTAVQLGLPFGDRRMTFNSRQAQEAGKWADHEGLGERFHQAVFRAYFAAGRNIARYDVLMDIVRAAGGDHEAARAALAEGRYRKAVDHDWQRARELGITAVPTLVYGGRRLVGAHPYRDMARFVAAR